MVEHGIVHDLSKRCEVSDRKIGIDVANSLCDRGSERRRISGVPGHETVEEAGMLRMRVKGGGQGLLIESHVFRVFDNSDHRNIKPLGAVSRSSWVASD